MTRRSILIWKDGTRTEHDVIPGAEALIRTGDTVTAFRRIGMERSMFVYEETGSVNALRVVDPEHAS